MLLHVRDVSPQLPDFSRSLRFLLDRAFWPKEKTMSKTLIFIQVQGRPGILEVELSEAATLDELHGALAAAGIQMDAETFIFIDEDEHHQHGDRHQPVDGIKHGSRIHVSRCKRIKTTVHFLDKTAEHAFPPGARVRAVKDWAAHTFKLSPKDAAEHVLQLCNSTERPPSDTPLHQLVHGHACELCFDLVPEKRVEG
jgi:hypothetical protein